MLQKPFRLLNRVDLNRYYVMELDDYNRYLATEGIFFLRKNAGAKPKERTQTLKLLRLSAPVLGLFIGYFQIQPTEEREYNGIKEKIYPRMDLTPVKRWINELMESQEDLKDGQYTGITTPDAYDNITVRALEQEGYELFAVIEEGSRTDTVLMVKQNPLGIFRIAELVLTGQEEKTTVSMNTHTFNKDIVVRVIENLDNFSSKLTNHQIDKILEREKENK